MDPSRCWSVVVLLLAAAAVHAGWHSRGQKVFNHWSKNSCSTRQNVFNRWSKSTCSARYSDPAAQIIQSVYSAVSTGDCELADPYSFPRHYNVTDGEKFDFIIVGAGSAGSVVANRLTEISGWKVLLIEAGGNPTKTVEVPALMSHLQRNDLDWQYKTDPEENVCLGYTNNQCNWPRGKLLGGSSSTNYMLYVRGNAKDYEGWVNEGNTGWGYEDVLPYFKKSEDMRAEEVLATPEFSKYHSTGGYLKVESWFKGDIKKLGDAFIEGMKELGYQNNSDYNGRNQTGFGPMQGTIQDGRRCSTAIAFLSPITGRKNLKVSKHSLATKILVDPKQKSAYGVEFINKDGKVIKALAKKEVIISGGSINTPQILMLSGIGPEKKLKQLNIPVVKDLPVGENLQDHMLMTGLVISLNYSQPPESPQESMFDFLMKKKGRYSSLGLTSYGGFINTIEGVDYPDVELLLVGFDKNSSDSVSGLLDNFGMKKELQSEYLEINKNAHLVLVLASLMRPYSRGKIELTSNDPKTHPKIITGYFTDKRDIETYQRFYDFIPKLIQTKGLKNVDAKLHEIKIPACNKFAHGSREYRECSLHHMTYTTHHPCCTSKMGPTDSPDSVVDPELKLKGINGLRIIDASVMPSQTTGNINAVVIMIGEKGADYIKRTWEEKHAMK